MRTFRSEICYIFFMVGVILFAGCRNCNTRWKSNFTEDELSWVRFEDSHPKYLLKYWENGVLYVDTIQTKWEYTDIVERRTSSNKCEENVVYYETFSGLEVLSKNRKHGLGFSKIIISKREEFIVEFNYLKKVITNEVRTDTSTINGHLYYEVYKDNNTNLTIGYSKKYGFIYAKNKNGDEVFLIR